MPRPTPKHRTGAPKTHGKPYQAKKKQWVRYEDAPKDGNYKPGRKKVGPNRAERRAAQFGDSAQYRSRDGHAGDDRRDNARSERRDDRHGRSFPTHEFQERPARTFDRDDRPRSQGRDDRSSWRERDDRRDNRQDDRRQGYGERGSRDFRRDDRDFRRADTGPNRVDRGPNREYRDVNRVDRGPNREYRGFDRDREPRRDARDFRSQERVERPAAARERSDSFARERSEPADRRQYDRGPRPTRKPHGDRPYRDDRGPFEDRRHRDVRGAGSRHFEREDFGRPADRQLGSDQMEWEPAAAPVLSEHRVEHAEGEGFRALGVPGELLDVLDMRGITSPFPIQSATIPDAIAGGDLLGRGQTGSGKTLAYSLPMVIRISKDDSDRWPRGLVLVPTRELAVQVADVVSVLGSALGLTTILVAGGMSYTPQLRAFKRGVDLVVATPGRLIDLMDQGAADLSHVMVSVLDEADQMSDMGFMPDVNRILGEVPGDSQHLLFSATLDSEVDKVVTRYLHDPVVHGVDTDKATVSTMTHQIWHVLPQHKYELIAQAANRTGKTLVFVRTQKGADRVAEQLRAQGVMAGALHGGLTQGARSRVMGAFKQGQVPVLVATDVAARGIDVEDVSLVLQADLPHDAKDYVHRAGRTARAGEKGVVVTIVQPRERRTMDRLARQAGVKAEPIRVGLGDEHVTQTTGGTMPQDPTPIEDADYQAVIAPRIGREKKKFHASRRHEHHGGQRRSYGRN